MALAIYCFLMSRAAQKVVSAVNGPPLLQEEVDFSKPFTNEFTFRHAVQPFYGTMYLTLKADPWPKGWTESYIASEDLKGAKGEMRVLSTNNVLVESAELAWFYSSIARSEPETAPVQEFFGRLPLGDYRLIIATTAAVPQLANTKQALILRYDLIHERTIASVSRNFSIAFGIAALIFAGAFIWLIRPRARLTVPTL